MPATLRERRPGQAVAAAQEVGETLSVGAVAAPWPSPRIVRSADAARHRKSRRLISMGSAPA